MIESVDKAAKESFHQHSHQDKSKPKRNPVPGWSESFKQFKDDAFFLHQVWHSAGQPINTELHRILKKKNRNVYHYRKRR